jgi:hypothetical protein
MTISFGVSPQVYDQSFRRCHVNRQPEVWSSTQEDALCLCSTEGRKVCSARAVLAYAAVATPVSSRHVTSQVRGRQRSMPTQHELIASSMPHGITMVCTPWPSLSEPRQGLHSGVGAYWVIAASPTCGWRQTPPSHASRSISYRRAGPEPTACRCLRCFWREL